MKITYFHLGAIAGAALYLMPALAAAQGGAPDAEKALALSQAAVGRTLPDYTLTAADGRRVRLSDFRGKPLLLQFIYTSCSQSCPIAVRYLQRAVGVAHEALGAQAFTVVSVGFNVPFDSPQAMDAFARRHGIRDAQWHFLAGDAGTIEAMTRELGFAWTATPKGFDHIAQLSLIDAGGVVYRQIYGEDFDAPLLVEPLKQLATGAPVAAGDWRSLLERVRLFCTVYDRSSGRYRLNYSLFVEIFAGITILGAVVFSLFSEWRRQRAR
jgi:protein SCO1/2